MTTETAQDEFHVGYLPVVDLTFFGHLEHVGETSMSVLAVFFSVLSCSFTFNIPISIINEISPRQK